MENVYDVQDVVDHAARMRNAIRQDWKGDMHWAGIIPIGMAFQLEQTWKAQGLSKPERQKELLKFLNDPDNSKLRVKTGKL